MLAEIEKGILENSGMLINIAEINQKISTESFRVHIRLSFNGKDYATDIELPNYINQQKLIALLIWKIPEELKTATK